MAIDGGRLSTLAELSGSLHLWSIVRRRRRAKLHTVSISLYILVNRKAIVLVLVTVHEQALYYYINTYRPVYTLFSHSSHIYC